MASDDARGRPAQAPPIEKIAQEAIEEARMVLPGIQALFGFQLMAIFNDKFRTLSEFGQRTHFVAMLLISLSIALIMTPAAYHRQVVPGSVPMSSLPLTGLPATTAEGCRNWMLKATMPMPKRKAIEVKVKALRSGFMGLSCERSAD